MKPSVKIKRLFSLSLFTNSLSLSRFHLFKINNLQKSVLLKPFILDYQVGMYSFVSLVEMTCFEEGILSFFQCSLFLQRFLSLTHS